jgi:hypothetical protein
VLLDLAREFSAGAARAAAGGVRPDAAARRGAPTNRKKDEAAPAALRSGRDIITADRSGTRSTNLRAGYADPFAFLREIPSADAALLNRTVALVLPSELRERWRVPALADGASRMAAWTEMVAMARAQVYDTCAPQYVHQTRSNRPHAPGEFAAYCAQ